MDADGKNQTRLTENQGVNDLPAWSPDGKRIAFDSYQNGNNEIYVIGADGKNLKNLTENQAFDDSPAWSPDGKRIAFVSNRDANQEIYVMDSDGKNQTRLTQNQAVACSPTWSPDGTKIAFLSKPKPSKDEENGPRERLYDDGYAVYVIDADGKHQKRLTENEVDNHGLAWNPNSTKIIFQSYRNGFEREIYEVDTEGKKLNRLTENQVLDIEPAWSPDGSKIVFVSSFRDIFVMDADGKNPKNLTGNKAGNKARDWGPAWSPDGTKIAFVSDRDGNWGVYVMDADGKNPKRLTENQRTNCSPAWSPSLLPEISALFADIPASKDVGISGISREKAIAIAIQRVKEDGVMSLAGRDTNAVEEADSWHICFPYTSHEVLGGEPHVLVDKLSGKVIRIYYTQ